MSRKTILFFVFSKIARIYCPRRRIVFIILNVNFILCLCVSRFEAQDTIAKQSNKRRCAVVSEPIQAQQSYDQLYQSIDSGINSSPGASIATGSSASQQNMFSARVDLKPLYMPKQQESQLQQSQPQQVYTHSQPQPLHVYSQSNHQTPKIMSYPEAPFQAAVNQSLVSDMPIILSDLIVDTTPNQNDKIDDMLQKILDGVEKNAKAIDLLEKKYDAFVQVASERDVKQDHMMALFEKIHHDFQIWQEISKGDEFTSEFILPLTNADDVEKLDSKLVTDSTFRIVMVKSFIHMNYYIHIYGACILIHIYIKNYRKSV